MRRRAGCRLVLRLHHFNPRTRVECDQGTRLWWLDVSYFNPRTRVECDGGGGIDTLRFNFNPRTRVECDRCLLLFVLNFGLFQSTHSCRVRRDVTTCRINGVKFQSTHSCRVRRSDRASRACGHGFQSTHSCRVRQRHLPRTQSVKAISIHALV